MICMIFPPQMSHFAIAPMTRPISGRIRPEASAEGGGQHHLSGQILSGCSAGPRRTCRVWFIWEAGQKHQKPMDGRLSFFACQFLFGFGFIPFR